MDEIQRSPKCHKVKKGTEAIEIEIARNAKGLLKPKLPKYQKSQKVKKTKGPTMTHKLEKKPEKLKMPKRRKKPGKIQNPKFKISKNAKEN